VNLQKYAKSWKEKQVLDFDCFISSFHYILQLNTVLSSNLTVPQNFTGHGKGLETCFVGAVCLHA